MLERLKPMIRGGMMILADVDWMRVFKPCGLERCEREQVQRGGIGIIMCFHSSRILDIHVVSL